MQVKQPSLKRGEKNEGYYGVMSTLHNDLSLEQSLFYNRKVIVTQTML